MRILIAEDDKISRDLMRLFISTEQRHTILQAANGEEALRLLEDPASGRVDLCILDVMMPKLDGLTLVERIRENEQLKGMRVILCTALSDRAKVQRAVQLGVLHYVVKPYVRSLILEKIRLVESELSAEESLEDQATVIERLGLTPDAYTEMLKAFLEELKSWVAFVKSSDHYPDPEALNIAANGFRGTALTLGTTVIARILSDMEAPLSKPIDEAARAELALDFNALENELKMLAERVKARSAATSG